MEQTEENCEFSEQEVEKWMKVALEQAKTGALCDEVPVGCVFVRQSEGRWQAEAASHNLTNQCKNASRHCEINCLREMEKRLTRQQITECILFVTVEPCIMCTFALNLVGVRRVFFGQFNDKFGGCGSLRSDNKFQTRGGIMEKESLEVIKDFYEKGNQKIPEELRNRSRKRQKREDSDI